LYKLLANPVYIGDAVHKGISYPGEHAAIIDRKIWDKVQDHLKTNARKRAAAVRAQTPALLGGIIYGPDGAAMSPSHSRRKGLLYRYYVSQTILKQAASDLPVGRVPAAEVERIVVDQVRILLWSPEIIVRAWRQAREAGLGLTEAEVRTALVEFEPLWDELFPSEQARIIQLLVERVDVAADGVEVKMRIDGIGTLVTELTGKSTSQQDAA
jgi:hypothetical protein